MVTGRVRIGQDNLTGPTSGNTISFNNNYRSIGIDVSLAPTQTLPNQPRQNWLIDNRVNGATHTGIRVLGVNSANLTCNTVNLSSVCLQPNNYAYNQNDNGGTVFNFPQINTGFEIVSTRNDFLLDGNRVNGDPNVPDHDRASVGINLRLNPGTRPSNTSAYSKNMVCNRIENVHTGIRFDDNNFSTGMFFTDIRNANWGIWFDNRAIVGQQGWQERPGIPLPSFVNDNKWFPNQQEYSVVASRNSDCAQYQPFIVRGNGNPAFRPTAPSVRLDDLPPPPFPTTAAPFSVPTSLNQAITDCGTRPNCVTPPSNGLVDLSEGNNALMLRPVLEHMALLTAPTDPVGFGAYFRSQQSFYGYAKSYAVLRDSSVIISNTYDSLKVSNLAKIDQVDSLIDVGDTINARIVNLSIVPNNVIEQNYRTVNNVLLKTICAIADSGAVGGSAHCLTGQCCTAIVPIANQCVYSGGMAVYTARTLLAGADTVFRVYNDDCWQGGGLPRKGTEVSSVSKNLFSVYPNPAQNELNISYQLPKGFDNAQIQITDLMGRTVENVNISSNSGIITLQTKDWSNGVYLVRITTPNQNTQHFKVVISK